MSLTTRRNQDEEGLFLWLLFCNRDADAHNVELTYMQRIKDAYPVFVHMTNRAFYFKYRKVAATFRTEIMLRVRLGYPHHPHHRTPPPPQQHRGMIGSFPPRFCGPIRHPTVMMNNNGGRTHNMNGSPPGWSSHSRIVHHRTSITTTNSTTQIAQPPPQPPIPVFPRPPQHLPMLTRPPPPTPILPRPHYSEMAVPRQVSPETVPTNGGALSSSPMMPLVPYQPFKDPITGRMTIVLVFLLFSGTQRDDVQCCIINGGTTFQIQWRWPTFLLHPDRIVCESTTAVDPTEVMAHQKAVQQNLQCLPQPQPQTEDPSSPSTDGANDANGATTSTVPKYYCTMDYNLPIQVEPILPKESLEYLAYPIKNGDYPNQHGCYLKVRLRGVDGGGGGVHHNRVVTASSSSSGGTHEASRGEAASATVETTTLNPITDPIGLLEDAEVLEF